ncbi:hypothetical protein SXCC_01211 [Gluconacetobacter sp. SXCC-1]|nr:hypothetical protein SXCC_01211 [Gluconacetobacter sp. SXCC-1]
MVLPPHHTVGIATTFRFHEMRTQPRVTDIRMHGPDIPGYRHGHAKRFTLHDAFRHPYRNNELSSN